MSGITPIALEGEHRAGASHAGLRLVEDQQHPALDAFVLERGEIPLGQLDDAAAAQDRLRNEGGQIAGALPVQQVERVVELGPPIDAGKARAIGVRRGDGEGPDRHRPIAPPPGLVGRGRRGAGHAMPGLREPHDLPAAGDQFRDLQRRLVRLAAGGQQQHFRQARHQPGQSLREIDDRRAEHRGEEMIETPDAVAHGGHDLRVRMPEDRAHLAGREVQHAPPLGVVEERALGPHRHEIDEFAAIAEQMAPRPRPKCRILPNRSSAVHGPAPSRSVALPHAVRPISSRDRRVRHAAVRTSPARRRPLMADRHVDRGGHDVGSVASSLTISCALTARFCRCA